MENSTESFTERAEELTRSLAAHIASEGKIFNAEVAILRRDVDFATLRVNFSSDMSNSEQYHLTLGVFLLGDGTLLLRAMYNEMYSDFHEKYGSRTRAQAYTGDWSLYNLLEVSQKLVKDLTNVG